MTKKAKTPVPIHCVYSDFAAVIPEEYRQTLPNFIQRTRRGTFPPYIRAEGKKTNPALFERQAIVAWSASVYGLHKPQALIEMATTLGVKLPRKKRAAK
jgi:hypothetical protein